MNIGRRTIVFASTALIFIFIFALGRHLELGVSSLKLTSPTTSHADAPVVADGNAAVAIPPVSPVSSSPTVETVENPSKHHQNPSAIYNLHPDAQTYFDQAFSAGKPYEYDFPEIRRRCERLEWPEKEEDIVYMKCQGMAAGLTSIISQVKTCLKYAIDSGASLVLPAMPLRDSTDLREFNFLNENETYVYDKWFDADHLISSMARACPKMKIVHPAKFDIEGGIPVKHNWTVDLGKAPGYMAFVSYFWPGRPFKIFWDDEVGKLKEEEAKTPTVPATQKGITVVSIHSMFLVYRITDDPTRNDLKLWNDIGNLIRFLPEPRELVNDLLELMPRPYYGVHFRVENDTIWSPLENQLKMNLEALDAAWAQDNKHGSPNAKKPTVYLACGDKEQVKKFQSAGAERGWEVTHKWGIAAKSSHKDDILARMDKLAFDFQGAIDMGILMQANFYMGITGSAFSSTVANARDGTGRYRGSSLFFLDDGGARNHLNNDGEANGYPCCL